MNVRRVAFWLSAALAVYAFVIRPRLLRWGATDEEVIAPYPGSDVIPGGLRSSTMAVTIDAPPAKVLSWLTQLGYRELELGHFLGSRASFDLQHRRRFDPANEQPRYFSDALWGFLLEPLPDDKTRLIVSGYRHVEPRWLQPLMSFALIDWTHWAMQTREFEHLKHRAAPVRLPSHW